MVLEVWGDGASSGTGEGCGGFCSLIKKEDGTKTIVSGGDDVTTNNLMEMQAIISGLENAFVMLQLSGSPTGNTLIVTSDSKYVMGAFMDNWLVKWISCGWHTTVRGSKKRPNMEKWLELVKIVSDIEAAGNKIEWRHVRGHRGIPENELCDEIAVKEKNRQKKIALDTQLCNDM